MAREKEVNVIVDAKNKSKRAFLEVKRDLKDIGNESQKNLSKFSGSLVKADKIVYSFADRMQFLDKIAKRTFQGTAAATGIYVAATLRDFSQLEDGISKVNTLYDNTTQSQQKMVNDSIKMFKMLPTDFEKITQGVYDTISAGGAPEYASMYARKFGMASVAGMTEMPTVTKAAMGTMNAFGKEIKDLNHILDLQFLTVKRGIVEYDQLASSLGTGVLKSAEGAGISMEELYTSIAQITKNAIPANIATTSLIQLFNKFTSSKSIKEFEEFGVKIQDANHNTRPMIEIMKDLNEQFDKRNMTSAQRAGYLKELLGSDEAARALMPLLGDLKEFNNVLSEMKKSSGAMEDAFGDRLDNMNTQMKLLWNNVKATGVEQLYNLKPLMDAMTGPMIEKQKLEFKKLDLEDMMSLEKDPNIKKQIKLEIKGIEAEISKIDITPVDDFRKALNESVEELNKFSPTLGDIANKVGNFAINHLGEEGAGQRETTGKWIKGIAYLSGLRFASSTIKSITGYTLGQVGVRGVKYGGPLIKSAAETGYIKSLYFADFLKTLGLGTTVASGIGAAILGTLGSQAAIWTAKKLEPYDPTLNANKAAQQRGSVKRLVDLKENNMYNENFDTITMQRIIDIVTSMSADKSVSSVHLSALSQDLYGEIYKNIQKDNGKLLNASGDITQYIVQKLQKIQSETSPSYADHNIRKKARLEEQMESKTNYNDFGKTLIDTISRDMQNISMKNEITVEPPKIDARFYVDSKQIPINRVEYDYDKVEINQERRARRYGKLD